MSEPVAQESYIVSEGKKRGSTRDVRPEALHDRFYTVLRVHAGDAILTDNWHTSEVLSHARNNFQGYTFAMRTLEAWGAMIGDDDDLHAVVEDEADSGLSLSVLELDGTHGSRSRFESTARRNRWCEARRERQAETESKCDTHTARTHPSPL